MDLSDEIPGLFLRSLARKDWAHLKSLLCDDATLDYPGARLVRGRAPVVLFLRRVMMRFDSIVFNIDETICHDGRICILWRNAGTLLTGKPFENRGATIVHLRGEQIASLSDYFKADVSHQC